MIRDTELKRLESYANSLGVRVFYRKLKKQYTNAAEFYSDGSGIIVYTWPMLSKTNIVLNLLHEVAHAVQWVHLNKTINKDLQISLLKDPKDLSKEERKLIYEDEHHATYYWDQIVKLVDIKIKPDIITVRKKLDIFAYRFFYETGDFPSEAEMKQKKKEYKDELKKERK